MRLAFLGCVAEKTDAIPPTPSTRSSRYLSLSTLPTRARARTTRCSCAAVISIALVGRGLAPGRQRPVLHFTGLAGAKVVSRAPPQPGRGLPPCRRPRLPCPPAPPWALVGRPPPGRGGPPRRVDGPGGPVEAACQERRRRSS